MQLQDVAVVGDAPVRFQRVAKWVDNVLLFIVGVPRVCTYIFKG
jgi:hypothetical protein